MPRTAIQCLVLAARHHGIDLSVERLLHEHALGDEEPGLERLIRIAQRSGLEAERASLDWQFLRTSPQSSFPLLLRLDNGNTVVAVGFVAKSQEIEIVDPIADNLDPENPEKFPLSREKIERAWKGEALLVRRTFREDHVSTPFNLRWFVPDLLRQRRLFRDVAVAALVLHGIGLAVPVFFQLVVDRVLVHQTYATLYVLSFGVVLALCFESVFAFLRQFLVLHATSKIDMRLAARVFAHLVSLPIAYFEREISGVVLQHVHQHRRIREFLTGRLFTTLLDASALLVFVPVLLLYSVKLTAIVLAFCTVIGLAIWALIPTYRARLLELYKAEAQRQGVLVETIHGMGTVKALALEPRRRRDWEERVAVATVMQVQVGKIGAVAHTVTTLLEKLMLVAIIAVGASDVFDGTLTVGALVAFQMLSNRVSGPLVQIVALINEYQETSLAVKMLGEIMNQPAEPGSRARGLHTKVLGEIAFDEVSFSYSNGRRVLDHAKFTLRPGSFVGIVGRSGSGKTTIARLIQGLYLPNEGAVRIDGINVREYDSAHLRRSVGIVLQETFLFRGTIKDNICAARPDASLEDARIAAQRAGAYEFIENLPRGMQTPIDEGGTNLSGGQKHRLAIARALLLNPRVLILDEATSSLDPESEAIVQSNLADIVRDRKITLIVITHRLSNLITADSNLVLDSGRIVDSGRHAELIMRKGLYQDLWLQQTKNLR